MFSPFSRLDFLARPDSRRLPTTSGRKSTCTSALVASACALLTVQASTPNCSRDHPCASPIADSLGQPRHAAAAPCSALLVLVCPEHAARRVPYADTLRVPPGGSLLLMNSSPMAAPRGPSSTHQWRPTPLLRAVGAASIVPNERIQRSRRGRVLRPASIPVHFSLAARRLPITTHGLGESRRPSAVAGEVAGQWQQGRASRHTESAFMRTSVETVLHIHRGRWGARRKASRPHQNLDELLRNLVCWLAADVRGEASVETPSHAESLFKLQVSPAAAVRPLDPPAIRHPPHIPCTTGPISGSWSHFWACVADRAALSAHQTAET